MYIPSAFNIPYLGGAAGQQVHLLLPGKSLPEIGNNWAAATQANVQTSLQQRTLYTPAWSWETGNCRKANNTQVLLFQAMHINKKKASAQISGHPALVQSQIEAEG